MLPIIEHNGLWHIVYYVQSHITIVTIYVAVYTSLLIFSKKKSSLCIYIWKIARTYSHVPYMTHAAESTLPFIQYSIQVDIRFVQESTTKSIDVSQHGRQPITNMICEKKQTMMQTHITRALFFFFIMLTFEVAK